MTERAESRTGRDGGAGRASAPGGRELRGQPAGRTDAAIGLLLLGVCGAVFWLSRDLPSPPFVPLGPAFYPRLVAGLLAVLALLLVVRGVRSRGQPVAADRGAAAGLATTDRVAAAGAAAGHEAARLGPVLLLFGTLAGYIALIPVLGFYASTFLFLVVLGWLLDGGWPARLPRAVVVAAATTVVAYLVFTKYLRVLFPEGLLR